MSHCFKSAGLMGTVPGAGIMVASVFFFSLFFSHKA